MLWPNNSQKHYGLLELSKMRGKVTLQDLGRRGWQHLGVCESGAADEYAFLWAQKLLNNPANTAALEITLGQVDVIFYGSAYFCVTGAETPVYLNDQLIPTWQTAFAVTGDSLKLGMPKHGLLNYLAIAGGFHCQKFCDSYSQCEREKLGPFSGQPFRAGTRLPFRQFNRSIAQRMGMEAETLCYRRPKSSLIPTYSDRQSLNMLPYDNNFLPSGWDEVCKEFLQSEFVIAPQSNRMGYRLSGAKIRVKEQTRICHWPSNGVAYGAVQLPPSGDPMVLLKDRQTMGGYPVIGYLTRSSANRLAQMRPGEKVIFKSTERTEAKQHLARRVDLFELKGRFI